MVTITHTSCPDAESKNNPTKKPCRVIDASVPDESVWAFVRCDEVQFLRVSHQQFCGFRGEKGGLFETGPVPAPDSGPLNPRGPGAVPPGRIVRKSGPQRRVTGALSARRRLLIFPPFLFQMRVANQRVHLFVQERLRLVCKVPSL